MNDAQFGAFLNVLLEAERAGARLLSDYLGDVPPGSQEWRLLSGVQRDEARNCAVLLSLLERTGQAASHATGDFYRKGLTVQGVEERLKFLNRGQSWVVRRIAEALPEVPAYASEALREMHASHVANVAACDAFLAALPGKP